MAGGPTERAVSRGLGRRQAAAESDVRRLIDAGRDLLATEPRLRVADLVARAGMSNDAFYRYFRGKEEFIAAVIEDDSLTLCGQVAAAMDSVSDPAERLRVGMIASLHPAVDPVIARRTRSVYVHENGHHRESGVYARLDATLCGFFIEPVRALGATDPERDTRLLVAALLGCMVQFLWSTPPGPGDSAHVADRLMRMVCGA